MDLLVGFAVSGICDVACGWTEPGSLGMSTWISSGSSPPSLDAAASAMNALAASSTFVICVKSHTAGEGEEEEEEEATFHVYTILSRCGYTYTTHTPNLVHSRQPLVRAGCGSRDTANTIRAGA